MAREAPHQEAPKASDLLGHRSRPCRASLQDRNLRVHPKVQRLAGVRSAEQEAYGAGREGPVDQEEVYVGVC